MDLLLANNEQLTAHLRAGSAFEVLHRRGWSCWSGDKEVASCVSGAVGRGCRPAWMVEDASAGLAVLDEEPTCSKKQLSCLTPKPRKKSRLLVHVCSDLSTDFCAAPSGARSYDNSMDNVHAYRER